MKTGARAHLQGCGDGRPAVQRMRWHGGTDSSDPIVSMEFRPPGVGTVVVWHDEGSPLPASGALEFEQQQNHPRDLLKHRLLSPFACLQCY